MPTECEAGCVRLLEYGCANMPVCVGTFSSLRERMQRWQRAHACPKARAPRACTSIMTHAGLKGACGCVSMRMASWPSLAARSSSAPHLESIVSVSQRNVGSSSTTSTGPRLSSTCSSAPTSATLPGGERGCAYGCARGCAYEASEAAASVEGEVLCGACLGASGDGACADAAGETASAADERVGERVGESAGECAAECAGESANTAAGSAPPRRGSHRPSVRRVDEVAACLRLRGNGAAASAPAWARPCRWHQQKSKATASRAPRPWVSSPRSPVAEMAEATAGAKSAAGCAAAATTAAAPGRAPARAPAAASAPAPARPLSPLRTGCAA
eukprot:316591-Pleurochrysis_carterae.AAC.3